MRITCTCCGSRDVSEFSYLGDASLTRPDPEAPDAAETFHAYVYLRDNPAGPQREFWYHASGCRSWLEVTRDTGTHEILGVRQAARR